MHEIHAQVGSLGLASDQDLSGPTCQSRLGLCQPGPASWGLPDRVRDGGKDRRKFAGQGKGRDHGRLAGHGRLAVGAH